MKTQIPFMTLTLLASCSSAMFGKKPPSKPPANLVDSFPWKNPFVSPSISSYVPTCEATATFTALEYTLGDVRKSPPDGLFPWSSGLKKVFSQREYPGSWSGYDKHLQYRGILRMEYLDIPLAVRLWIEEQERSEGDGKGLFAVFEKPKVEGETFGEVVHVPGVDQVNRLKDGEKVAIFAPGAMYHIIPLWLADKSNCKEDLLNLSKYKPAPEDGAVVGWIDHKAPKGHKSEIRFTAKVLGNKITSSDSEAEAKVELPKETTRQEL